MLAAGLGSRFGGIKQLTAVGPEGDVIFDYSAHDALAAGFDRIVLVTRSEIEAAMTEHVRRRWPAGVDVRIVCQDRDGLAVRAAAAGRTKPLGTAHASLVGLGAAETPFTAVVNADDLYGAVPYRLVAAAGPSPALVTFPVGRTVIAGSRVTRALCTVDGSAALVGIEEGAVEGAMWTGESGRRVTLAGTEPVSMNFWGFGEGVLERLEGASEALVASGHPTAEALLPDVVRAALAEGERVSALHHDGDCIGLTHPDDAARVRALITGPAW